MVTHTLISVLAGFIVPSESKSSTSLERSCTCINPDGHTRMLRRKVGLDSDLFI